MRPSHPILSAAALLVLAAMPAAADVPTFGVQGALLFPTNDLANVGAPGFQIGGHAQWNFGGGNGLVARADLGFYGSHNGVTTNSLGIAGDYTYHIDRNRTGVYVLAGLSFINYAFSNWAANSSLSGLGLDLGAGYDVDRNLGLQVRYTAHSLDGNNLSSLNLGVTYTF